MKHFFNDQECYNSVGTELHNEIEDIFDGIFKKWMDKGYSSIEIEVIARNAIAYRGAIFRLKRQAKLARGKRNETN